MKRRWESTARLTSFFPPCRVLSSLPLARSREDRGSHLGRCCCCFPLYKVRATTEASRGCLGKGGGGRRSQEEKVAWKRGEGGYTQRPLFPTTSLFFVFACQRSTRLDQNSPFDSKIFFQQQRKHFQGQKTGESELCLTRKNPTAAAFYPLFLAGVVLPTSPPPSFCLSKNRSALFPSLAAIVLPPFFLVCTFQRKNCEGDPFMSPSF